MAAADTASPRFDIAVRVYWEDTDGGGIVYYANYLRYFERARSDWLRALGISQQRLREETGAIFVVSEVQLGYLQPARLDDALRITVQPLELRPASMRIAQEAWCGERLLTQAQVRVGWVDAQSLKPRRMPEALMQAMRGDFA